MIGTKSSTGELADACRRFTFSEIEQLTGAVSLVATCSRTSRRPVARQGWVPLQVVQERRGRMNLAGIAEPSAPARPLSAGTALASGLHTRP